MIPLIFDIILGEKGVKNILDNKTVNWLDQLDDESLHSKAGFTLDAVVNKTNKVKKQHLDYVKAHLIFLIHQKRIDKEELDKFEQWFVQSTTVH